MMNEIYLALGSAFFGSLIITIYSRLNGNGTNARLARLEERLFYLEKEIEEIKELIKRQCKMGVI